MVLGLTDAKLLKKGEFPHFRVMVSYMYQLNNGKTITDLHNISGSNFLIRSGVYEKCVWKEVEYIDIHLP